MEYKEWQFGFVLSSDTGEVLSEDECTEFLERIIELAEAKGLVLGGGFSPCHQSGCD